METNYYVFIHRPGPNWLPGKPITAQPLADHFEYMGEMARKGILVLGGGFLDDTGALGIFACSDLEAARNLAEADPAVLQGVVILEIHPYFLTVGGFKEN